MEEERTGHSNATGAATKESSRTEIYTDIQAVSHPVLPSNAIATYLDEGAANIVYSLSVPPPHEKPASSYRDAFPNTQHRTDGFSFWDGKSSFHSAIHVSLSFSQSFSLLMSCVIIFLFSDKAVTPFSERNNIYPLCLFESRVDPPLQANCYVYAKNYHGQLLVLLHKETSY